MITALRAEWIRFSRPKMLTAIAVCFAAFGVLGAALTFATAVTSSRDLVGREKFETTLAALAYPGGASHGFLASTSLLGLVIAVLAAATIGTDYSLGTWRPLLIRHPQRTTLLIGKILAFATLVAIGLATTQLAALATSYACAHFRDVATADWVSVAGLRAAGSAYAKALFICTAWQLLGTAAALLSRSVTISVVTIVVWAVPIERILGSSLTAAPHWLPGLLLEALSVDDTKTATTSRVLTMVTVYAAILLTIAVIDFRRRDITV